MSVLLLAGAASRSDDTDRPRLDYVELARALDADVSYPQPVGGARGRVLGQIPGNWPHAWSVRDRTVSAFVSLAEGEGMPLALTQRTRAPHVMIAHNVTTTKLRAIQRATRWLRRVDEIIVLSRAQESYVRDEAGVPADRVHFVYDKVDHRFFRPSRPGGEGGYVLSVGSEARDYPTLLQAVGDLGLPTVLVPSSLWFGAADVGALPPNVTTRRNLPYTELRELYEQAAVVAVPVLPGARYAAGVNAVLEAMAMRKPLVVTDTPGLAGYLDDGETMRTVPPGDAAALGSALQDLLRDRETGDRLAGRAREVVDAGRNLDGYVDAIAGVVRSAQVAAP